MNENILKGRHNQGRRPEVLESARMYLCAILTTYSCFQKGCPTKPYATMPKGIMDNGDLRYLIEAFGVLVT